MAVAGRKPGTPKTGGRKKGTPNKTTTQLKEAILQAAEQTGNPKGEGEGGLVGYLKFLAVEHPTPFSTLLGKVLPLQLTGEGGRPIAVEHHSAAVLDALARKHDAG